MKFWAPHQLTMRLQLNQLWVGQFSLPRRSFCEIWDDMKNAFAKSNNGEYKTSEKLSSNSYSCGRNFFRYSSDVVCTANSSIVSFYSLWRALERKSTNGKWMQSVLLRAELHQELFHRLIDRNETTRFFISIAAHVQQPYDLCSRGDESLKSLLMDSEFTR